MARVKVTVTSDLPEFGGILPIIQEPIEPDITWAALFQLHKLTKFSPDNHCIKSTRNTAFAQDTVQDTSTMYRKNAIMVKIVSAVRTPAASPVKTPNRSSTSASTRGKGSRRQRINRTSIPFPTPGPSSARPRQIEMNGLREATFGTNTRGGASSSANRLAGNLKSRSNGPGRSNGPQRPIGPQRPNGQQRPNGTGRSSGPSVFDFPEDEMEGSSRRTGQGPILDHLNDAASIASEEDDDERGAFGNPSDSQLKARVRREIGRVPNGDFDSILQELRNLVGGEQRYRWLRKAPMAGSLLLQAFNV